jgi:hypothetical protein
MTQTLYAHINKRKKNSCLTIKCLVLSEWLDFVIWQLRAPDLVPEKMNQAKAVLPFLTKP